ncbi:MAG: peptidylprolyl isomerase [Gemmatimonadaceae bacterium]|nr:peptidylprolyl isomerase [Gemmatimonadaceae bacterium]
MKTRSLLAFTVACVAITGCQGIKDAFNAHSDTVARAGSQELSVTRLGDLMGKTPLQVQPTKENAAIVAGLWVDYQLMGLAAAKNDSLNTPKELADAGQTYTINMLLRHFQAHIDSTLTNQPPSEATYDAGAADVFDARHILFQFPPAATQSQKDSVHKKAMSILPQVNAKNFAEMAKKYSSDGSAQQGGNLGVFPRREMVPEFGDAVAALKPGQISGLVQTQYGYHIIQRLPYAEAKAEYDSEFTRIAASKAEQAYVAQLDSTSGIQVKPGAAQAAKVAAADPASHRKDNTVLASYKGGNLTVSRYLTWLDGMPPQQNITQQIQQAPDSIIQIFLRSLAGQEVMLKRADSLHIVLSPAEQTAMSAGYLQWVTGGWTSLGVDPHALADSAKTESARETLAATRVDSLIAAIMAGTVRPIAIPTPLKLALESKFSWSVNQNALDRAVEIARKLRSTADSARAANQPPSQVPLPGAPPADTTKTKKK